MQIYAVHQPQIHVVSFEMHRYQASDFLSAGSRILPFVVDVHRFRVLIGDRIEPSRQQWSWRLGLPSELAFLGALRCQSITYLSGFNYGRTIDTSKTATINLPGREISVN
jgi:hypothetical protein